jgi:hypothetical protein
VASGCQLVPDDASRPLGQMPHIVAGIAGVVV